MAGIGLHIGLRGLLAAQSALETVGHNVANAGTEGYSRQRLHLTAARALERNGLRFGAGVDASVVRRMTDQLLTRRIVTQTSVVGKLDALLAGMSGVEAVLGEPNGLGVGALVDELLARMSDLSTSPEDAALRTGVAQSAADVTAQLRRMAGELTDLQRSAAEGVALAVTQVNALAGEIAGLNREIAKEEAAGVPANDLRDARDLAVTRLAKQIDVTAHETQSGAVQVQVAGQLLVGPTQARALRVEAGEGGVELFVKGGTKPVDVTGGEIGALLRLSREFAPDLRAEIDLFAHGMILQLNRAHSTGVPASGGFRSLIGTFSIEDRDGDGDRTDELLSAAGLPFDVQSGELFVHVQNAASGLVETRRIAIDADRTTVGDLLATLQDAGHLSASLDSLGRVRIAADAGHTFDFSRRLDRQPALAGTFGGRRASYGSALAGPFDLAAGSTLVLQGPSSSFTVTFDPADFENLSAATAHEVAAAIDAHPGMAANMLRATVEGGRLFLQTMGEGAGQSFSIQGGTALGALGLGAATVTGQDLAVGVTVHGAYGGDRNQELFFRALSDGTVGTTDGLQVEVRDAEGRIVATLDVGAGYVPGSELAVADGIGVSFTYGDVSATDRDAFAVELLADSDTSDVLVALGLNSFYVGSDAESIGLRPDIESDPSRLATSFDGAPGDNGALLAMMQAPHLDVPALGGTPQAFYADLVGQVGFEIGSTESALEVEQLLMTSLEERRAQVSGVNIDEELVDMIQFEQAFAAASQFIQVVNSIHEEVLNLI